ncbi:RNA-binding transcriptional accessory protein [Bacillus luteus]|uniref:RNA-binding transcriptional accessory protein n=2 Tax=Alkalicoccus luteus TaxID=1237094 RepID=A0A969TW47_9BACI|nr:Tex family protein [Alkalicoccus luteus]NJP38691.1 RNA-binding transcriptional accessory protein [Alkalicoccus luteus]
MDQTIVKHVHMETNLPAAKVETVLKLAEEGNTVPFIARYRKEMTGGMDEEEIRSVLSVWEYAVSLAKRKEEVHRLIEEQGKWTEELAQSLRKAEKLQEVEDLYRPYKQKKRTRASIAKEQGLEPLAEWLQAGSQGDPLEKASAYVAESVETAAEALQGAKDIIAETVADDPSVRRYVRHQVWKKGSLKADKKAKAEDEKEVFALYYEYEEKISRMVPHRTLAVNRGEKEGVLRVKVMPPAEEIEKWAVDRIVKRTVPAAEYLKAAVEDSLKRLVYPAVEREIRGELSEKAEAHAIEVFSTNLRQLLLQPPLKGHVVLGVDPAYRTGCKLAAVNETGMLLETGVVYPTAPHHQTKKAAAEITRMINEYGVTMIAVGNGTASRETEQFIADVIQQLQKDIYYLIVNEAGASVYSASKTAKEEFPSLQVEERSAVSIARRLQDPLAELVKIDPKSVGVGQYQHDVSQSKLSDSLTFVVETVVNRVGVNVNTASASLLAYVSGLSAAVAGNIVRHRDEEGRFQKRTDLKKVPRLGAKTYEQSIGFLRIPDGKEPLDATSIHPESYKEAGSLLKQLSLQASEIGSDKAAEAIKELNRVEAADSLGIGLPTLEDILDAFQRPGRDPREEVAKPLLKQDVLSMEDLYEGLELEGTVRNVVDFGAFVDIGVKQDGLVHISKLADRFVKHPMDVVSVGDVVTVWIDGVDAQKGRISLTMKRPS